MQKGRGGTADERKLTWLGRELGHVTRLKILNFNLARLQKCPHVTSVSSHLPPRPESSADFFRKIVNTCYYTVILMGALATATRTVQSRTKPLL